MHYVLGPIYLKFTHNYVHDKFGFLSEFVVKRNTSKQRRNCQYSCPAQYCYPCNTWLTSHIKHSCHETSVIYSYGWQINSYVEPETIKKFNHSWQHISLGFRQMVLRPSTYNWPVCNPTIHTMHWTNSSDVMANFTGPRIRTPSRNITGTNITACWSIEFLQEN